MGGNIDMERVTAVQDRAHGVHIYKLPGEPHARLHSMHDGRDTRSEREDE